MGVADELALELVRREEDNDDEMVAVGQALEAALDRDQSETFDRSEVVRLAVRVGMQEAVPEKMDQLSEAVGTYAQQL